MFIKSLKALSAGICALLFVSLFVWSIRIPMVVYSASTVEYVNGIPNIEVWDVVEVLASSGEKLPRSEWENVLASDRYEAVPSEE